MNIDFKKIDLLAGWTVFVVSATVYLLTIEPTASLWDCGEFISLACKLEIGHSPGAPFFMLVGNLFSQFAPDPALVAKSINAMSALMSAFTVLFLFWTITHLARRLLAGNRDSAKGLNGLQMFLITACGIIGALSYSFSDTFWFSAVEAEVYAFSSMLTSLVFWLILKWDENREKPHSDKWLILIAYIMGISIGVHLLNLLCIPAICLVYYFRKAEKPGLKNGTVAVLLSFGLIFLLMYSIVPGFTRVGGWFELFFVNKIGLPYNSGVFVYLAVLLAAIVWTIFETISQKADEKRARTALFLSFVLSGIFFTGSNPWIWVLFFAAGIIFTFRKKGLTIRTINLVSACLMVFLIGCSVYALVPIRSSANPPLNLNAPENIFSLKGYLNRDQYGQKPLVYGRTFASDIQRTADGTPLFKTKKEYSRIVKLSADEKDRYIVRDVVDDYRYTHTLFFPRMYSGESSHIRGYKRWGGVTDENVAPTMWQNIRYFLNYQVNFMYWRYFMWNFSGRQNDIQGDGGIMRGNWITGIPFIDNHILGLGSQKDIAPVVADNKGRNTYFMLPLLLGFLGIFYQLSRKKYGVQGFFVILALFFMTGPAIVFYINQTPYEPRERDYAYVGSFYAFCIWMGLGVAGVCELLGKFRKDKKMATITAVLASLVIPVWMGVQNWDDHDRSGRTIARDMAMNFLNCVEPGGIIFTFGDNDTYPLWYVQEVEGFRTDVRVANLAFLTTDWYVDQMRRRAYASGALPITWAKQQYSGDAATHAYVISRQQIENALKKSNVPRANYGLYYDTESFKDTLSLNRVLDNIKNGTSAPVNPFIKNAPVIPASVLSLDIDSAHVDWRGMNAKPTDKMHINLENKDLLNRNELMMLELVNSINDGNWGRPAYFAVTVDPDLFMNLQDHFSLEGIAYRLTPGQPSQPVNTSVAYDNFMHKFRWGGIDKDATVYLDEKNRGMITILRTYAVYLVDSLISEGKNDKASDVLDKCAALMPAQAVPYGMEGISMANAYYRLNEGDKASSLLESIDSRLKQDLYWFRRLNAQQITDSVYDVYNNLNQLLAVTSICLEYDPARYSANVGLLLDMARFFYVSGLSRLGDFILQESIHAALRAYCTQTSSGTPLRPYPGNDSLERDAVNRIVEMMKKYSPDLAEKYVEP